MRCGCACLVQETHTAGEATLAAERTAGRAKWQFAINDAVYTDNGSTSAGVGVAVRTHIGLGEDADAQAPAEWHSRIAIRWMGGYSKGGIHLISTYLWHSEGLSPRNLDLLEVAAKIIRGLRGPWLMGGDFNVAPQILRTCGWLELVGAEIRGTGQSTCKGKENDYFILPRPLLNEVIAALPVVDADISPHTPVRIILRGAPRSHWVRQLAAPPKCPAQLPQGCMREEDYEQWRSIAQEPFNIGGAGGTLRSLTVIFSDGSRKSSSSLLTFRCSRARIENALFVGLLLSLLATLPMS